jgi:hypothetical protein
MNELLDNAISHFLVDNLGLNFQQMFIYDRLGIEDFLRGSFGYFSFQKSGHIAR